MNRMEYAESASALIRVSSSFSFLLCALCVSVVHLPNVQGEDDQGYQWLDVPPDMPVAEAARLAKAAGLRPSSRS